MAHCYVTGVASSFQKAKWFVSCEDLANPFQDQFRKYSSPAIAVKLKPFCDNVLSVLDNPSRYSHINVTKHWKVTISKHTTIRIIDGDILNSTAFHILIAEKCAVIKCDESRWADVTVLITSPKQLDFTHMRKRLSRLNVITKSSRMKTFVFLFVPYVISYFISCLNIKFLTARSAPPASSIYLLS